MLIGFENGGALFEVLSGLVSKYTCDRGVKRPSRFIYFIGMEFQSCIESSGIGMDFASTTVLTIEVALLICTLTPGNPYGVCWIQCSQNSTKMIHLQKISESAIHSYSSQYTVRQLTASFLSTSNNKPGKP